jgi:hypothetical protein
MVRDRTNEPNLPAVQTVLNFANAGVKEIERQLGGIKLVGVFPTVPNQIVQALTNDIQDIISCSWSTGPVTAQGSLVYPMFQYDQGSFMDMTAGFPAVGFGPPVYYWVYRDQGGTMEMQMYPAAMTGQLNVYYRARPFPWTLTSSGGNDQVSNIDPSMQEAVIIWTMMRVLENRGRRDDSRGYQDEFKEMIEDLKSTAAKRTAPKSGVVRDVRGRGYPAGPWGWL